MGSPLRSALRLAIYLPLTLAGMPVQLVAVALGLRFAERFPIFYHRLCCRIFGISIDVRGRISAERPTLFVGNHTSYLDIMVFGALMPVSFIAKTEVGSWPLFGWLARLQRTVFVDRQRRTARAQRDDIGRRLAAGDNLMLFPEGTSNDGNRVLPFRSALFGAAELRANAAGPGKPVTVQPVSIAYSRLDGVPIGYTLRPLFAWYGDMEMGGHLWQVAGLGRITVVVEFHPPTSVAEFASRKALAEHCRRQVVAGVAAVIAGYRTAPQPRAVAVPETLDSR